MYHPDYLVDSAWLADHLQDANLRVLDVTAMLTRDLVNRAEAEVFAQGHIPGAVFFDVPAAKGVLSDANARLPWMWPGIAQFEAVMAQFGISNDTRVVITARTPRGDIDAGTMWCTRAWWTMHHYGVDCAVLAGGVEKWESEGRPLTDGVTTVEPGTFTATDRSGTAKATREQVLAAIGNDATCLVDALSNASFGGRERGYGPRKGHIQGAVNVPARALLNAETANFKSPDELRNALADLTAKEQVITYCGGAIAATVDAFALKLIGYDNVAVYDGSLMEWSADDTLPMIDDAADTE